MFMIVTVDSIHVEKVKATCPKNLKMVLKFQYRVDQVVFK